MADADPRQELEQATAALRAELHRTARRALLRWVVRQAIAVALLVWVTRTYGSHWWWAALPIGLLALGSLVSILRLRSAV